MQLRGDYPAEPIHLALGEGMLRMTLQARVNHPFHCRMTFEPCREVSGTLDMLTHAQMERFQAAHRKEGIEWATHGTHGILQEGHLLGHLGGGGHDRDGRADGLPAE